MSSAVTARRTGTWTILGASRGSKNPVFLSLSHCSAHEAYVSMRCGPMTGGFDREVLMAPTGQRFLLALPARAEESAFTWRGLSKHL
jgi:hypothetical protein